MTVVEVHYSQGLVVLRAKSSELLILAEHVSALQGLTDPKEFSQYFMRQALVNRPARKLFEAWLRKDNSVWPRLFKTIHSNKESSEAGDAAASGSDATEPKEAASNPS